MARSGQVGIGKDWLGAELEIVDRVLATVPLRVLGRDRYGEAGSGSVRANVAAMRLAIVSWSIQKVYQQLKETK